MSRGYWIFICDIVIILKIMKIIWEIYENSDKKIHNNFKLFFDEKLILTECKKYVEDMTFILNIDNENVDDLEAAHDIWVNVLEEKILTESVMNQTQKDVLEIMEDSSYDKTNIMGPSISNTWENKNINLNNTGNSIISIKSFYNVNSTNHGNKKVNNNLQEITNWTFLKDV